MDKHDNKNNVLCHAREVLVLNDALCIAKARQHGEGTKDVRALEDTLEREMADLYLLLGTIVHKEVIKSRIKKFPSGILN